MERDTITGRQGFFLLFLFLLGNLVTAGGAKGVQGGWLLFLILSLLSVPIFALFLKAVHRRQAGMVFVDSLGAKAGAAVTVVYCLLAILLAGDAVRLFADFIVINDLNDAGAWGNSALLTITVLLLLYSDLRSQGKAAWVIQPLTLAALLLSVALTIGKMEPRRVLPLFDEDAVLLLKGGFSSLATMLMPAFFPILILSGAAPVSWRKSTYAAGVSAGLLMAVLTFRDATVLGFPTTALFRFPVFMAAGAFRHSEILISAAFVLTQPFRMAFCLRYVQACLTCWKPRWRLWYPPLLLIPAVISGVLSWSSEQVRWRTGGEIAITALLLLGPLAVILADWRRRKKQNA